LIALANMQAKTISKHNLTEQYLKKENQYIMQNMPHQVPTPTKGTQSLQLHNRIEKSRLAMNTRQHGHNN